MKTGLIYLASIVIFITLCFSCQKEIYFDKTVTPIINHPASYTLAGAPGTCMSDTLTGNYIKGVAMDTGNYIKIAVEVTVAGSYAVSTDTVNGYHFSATGTFTNTGVQTVRLASTGTPLNAGTNAFAVSAGLSSCGFSVTVLSPVVTTNVDLLPLTANNYWVYDESASPGTSIRRTIRDTISYNGKLYKIMGEQGNPVGNVDFYYRKNGADYFEYGEVDKYTGAVRYKTPRYDDLPFLKENLTAGQAWMSAEYSDTASFGQVINLQYDYVCLSADISTVINGKAFPHVYVVQMKPQIRSLDHGFNNTGEVYTYYYAKGIGLIYYKETNLSSNYGDLKLDTWVVN